MVYESSRSGYIACVLRPRPKEATISLKHHSQKEIYRTLYYVTDGGLFTSPEYIVKGKKKKMAGNLISSFPVRIWEEILFAMDTILMSI